MKFLILFAIFGIHSTTAQSISCIYQGVATAYSCTLIINNPNGFDNFTDITGNHLLGLDDIHVQSVTADFGISSNFPRIICDKFVNARFIRVQNIHIQEIGENSFFNCQVLNTLNLINNEIKSIHPNAFVRNSVMDTLTLSSNQLSLNDSTIFNSNLLLTSVNLDNNPLGDLPLEIFR